jgi:NAD(P)H-hydrate epimerase
MREADTRAVARLGQSTLIAAAGFAVALAAVERLRGAYGRRIAVLVGTGLNGADGRAAARELSKRGATCEIIEASTQPDELLGYDLVIDAVVGLGCTRPYVAPLVGETPVIAVDLPSGVNADTGEILGTPLAAEITVAMGALKWAHVDGASAALCGRVVLAPLGIEVTTTAYFVDELDPRELAPRLNDDHKWRHAVQVVAGSPDMPGAAVLVCAGALTAGASMVRLTTHGDVATKRLPVEVVRANTIDARCHAVVIGPGLGPKTRRWLRRFTWSPDARYVLDADALKPKTLALFVDRDVVITPHEGEFQRLTNRVLGSRRVPLVREFAQEAGVTVLLKGPRTIIATPEGELRIVASGSSALATAGSGDVLAGWIGALLAYPTRMIDAVSAAAFWHGRSGSTWPTASDIVDGDWV